MDISTPLNIARGDSPPMEMSDFDVIHTTDTAEPDQDQSSADMDPLNLCEFSMQTFNEIDPLDVTTTDTKPKLRKSKRQQESAKKYESLLSKDAERMRHKRYSETGTNRENRRARSAYLARIRRQNMPSDAKEKMRIADKERAKLKRATETPEEREARNKRDAERKRKRRRELAQFKKLLEQLEAGTVDFQES